MFELKLNGTVSPYLNEHTNIKNALHKDLHLIIHFIAQIFCNQNIEIAFSGI